MPITLETRVERNPDILTSEIDQEVVMMSIEQGSYFGLNSVASSIWTLLDEPTTVEVLVGELMKEYEISKKQCEEEICQFLNEMIDQEIVSICN